MNFFRISRRNLAGRYLELDELKGSIKGSFSKSPHSTELFTHGEGGIMKVGMTGSSTIMGRLVGDEGLCHLYGQSGWDLAVREVDGNQTASESIGRYLINN